MRLTVFTDYSLRVLLMLATQRDSLLTIGEVAAYFRISEAHLMKVTHTLGRSGWVETVRGRKGGMRLTADADTLRLDTIIDYLEGSFELAECFKPSNTCRLTGACGLETALAGAADAFRARLKQHTLGSMASATPMKLGAQRVVVMPVKSRVKTTS
jgi:Rrf2 family transcriptional regulator, nitric oxide-sensitive transcriptional repressor